MTRHPVWRASVRLAMPLVMEKERGDSWNEERGVSDGWWYKYI